MGGVGNNMVSGGFMPLVMLALAVIVTLMKGVRTVPQGTQWTVERFGRYRATLYSGLNLIIHDIGSIGRKINVQETVLKKARTVGDRHSSHSSLARSALLLLFLCNVMCGTATADELRIVFSQYTPPYVFENGTGIVVDIVRTALAASGHTIKPVYVPIERGFKMFAEKQVDGTTIIQESAGLKAEYSDDFMQYHNRAFTLKSRNIAIRGFSDLDDKSVVAFQNADKYLGDEFAHAIAENKRYKEMAQQEAQTQMLLLGRIDVAIIDESIFRYYRQKLIAERKVQAQEFTGYDIFPPTPYKAAFIDSRVRDDFDRGIAAMRKDGRYDAIYRKYTEQYFPVSK